jgi:autonomous glycyl radical cofactor GrcA
LVGTIARAQSLTYTKGQNIAPAYEGWEQDPDGSKWFVFGYMNRNWVEEIDLPTGPENSIMPGGPDQGQPTHFLPRRNRFVFRVAVPKNFTEKDEMIWTLTAHGVTEKAWATLRADYLLDNVVKASETGALGAGTSSPEVRSNVPPTVQVEGPKTLTAKVGQPLTLTAVVKDDGIPKPRVTSALSALFGAQPARGAGPGGATGATASTGAAGAPAGSGAGSATGTEAGAAAGSGAGAATGAGRGGPQIGLLTALSGNATPEQLNSIAEGLGISVTQLQQLVAQRRNPSMAPPSRITVGKVTGLHLSWFVYRGAGKVTFDPEQVKPWEDTRANMNSPWAPLWTPPVMPKDGKVVVNATFDDPGTYVLRGLADDGALFGGDSVTVTVAK